MKSLLRIMTLAVFALACMAAGLGLTPRPSFAEIKFAGDLRLREQYEEKNDNTRNRLRFRFRLGADAKVVDKVNVGAGLATSDSTDPRSRNQTLDNSFASKAVWIDYAYAKYAPFVWLSMTGGKFKNPLWRPADFQLWDSDITPEGVAVQLKRWVDPVDLFFNTGALSIDEVKSSKNPFLFPFQFGVDWKISHRLKLTVAPVFYLFINETGNTLLDSTAGSNTKVGGTLKYDYNAFGGGTELGVMDTFVPYIGLSGDFIYNPDPGDNNIGYIAGVSFGHKTVTDKKQWRLRYLYHHIEQDAWLDILPDSDVLSGATNVMSHKVIAEYGLAKNVWFAANYYHSEVIEATAAQPEAKQNIVQIDFNFKF